MIFCLLLITKYKKLAKIITEGKSSIQYDTRLLHNG